MTWSLHCSACAYAQPDGRMLASLCPDCGQPLLARVAGVPARASVGSEASLWRYRAALPLLDGETPVTLGEGMTPLLELPHLAREVGVRRLWVKDEGLAYFRSRVPLAQRDVEHGLQVTLDYFTTREQQERALDILQFKLDVLWQISDAIEKAYP